MSDHNAEGGKRQREEEFVEEAGETQKFRWDTPGDEAKGPAPVSSRWSAATPRQYGGSESTPRAGGGGWGGWQRFATPSATPMGGEEVGTPRFDTGTPQVTGMGATPRMGFGMNVAATPSYGGMQTPRGGVPGVGTFGVTPSYQFEGTTPMQSHYAVGGADPLQLSSSAIAEERAKQLETEWRLKNKRLTVEFLDELLPSSEYFAVVEPPPDYNPLSTDEPNFVEIATKEVSRGGHTAASLGAQDGGTLDIPDTLGPGMPEMTPADAPVFVELLRYANKEETIPPAELMSYMLMKNLFKIKNGDTTQRRAGTRYLVEKAHIFGASLLFERLFAVWRASNLDTPQKHYLIEFCKTLITQLEIGAVRQSCKEIVHMMETLLSAQELVIREDGRQTLMLLARVVGFRTIWQTIRPDLGHEDSSMRRHTAKVVALIAAAAGMDDTLEELKKQSHSKASFIRQTTARALGEICAVVGHAAVSSLVEIVAILERLIRDERRVAREAALAVAMLAEVCAPFGREELSVVVHQVCEECRKGLDNSAAPFLRAFGSLLPLMSAEESRHVTATMMPVLVNQFNTLQEEYRRTLLSVVRRCVLSDGTSADFLRNVLLDPFFSGFWRVQRLAADKKTSALLLSTTVAIAKKVGSVDILVKLSSDMKDDNERFQMLVLHGIRRVVSSVGLDDVKTELCRILVEKTISIVQMDEEGTNRVAMDTLGSICNALGARMKIFFKDVFQLIARRGENINPIIRTQAAEFTSRIARTVIKAKGTVYLQSQASKLFTKMDNEEPITLGAYLRATKVLLEVLGSEQYPPKVGCLLEKLTHVIKNSASVVQQNAVILIEVIAENYDDEVEAFHLHQLATRGLFDLLDADRRETRRICARTFGVIASKISPYKIILELVDNFRQDKRKIRICTAVALGAIAKSCGPYTVLPYILNEFQVSESEQVAVVVQHAVLKAVRYIFEAVEGRAAGVEDYVVCCLPLLQRAMTEASIQMRRMAIEAARAILLAVAGVDGFSGVAIHLLNFAHPNIVELVVKKEGKAGEERLKLVSAVVSFYEAARLHVGSGVLYAYLVQGLFHPAKMVRDVFRRAYNMVYLASPEQLVPHYPLVENDTEYHVYEKEGETDTRLPVKRFFRYEIQVPF